LIVSKVSNFAIDLPDANVAIQVSGTSARAKRMAQRLGRILRPKPGANQARFYALVTAITAPRVRAEPTALPHGTGLSVRDSTWSPPTPEAPAAVTTRDTGTD
jgi:superfamily II DNA or RNA helicase